MLDGSAYFSHALNFLFIIAEYKEAQANSGLSGSGGVYVFDIDTSRAGAIELIASYRQPFFTGPSAKVSSHVIDMRYAKSHSTQRRRHAISNYEPPETPKWAHNRAEALLLTTTTLNVWASID